MNANLLNILAARRAPLSALLLLTVQPVVAQDLRDPTAPPRPQIENAKNTEVALRLEAILLDGARRIAIVNGRVMREGDRIDDAVLASISAHAIQYVRHGRTHQATLRRQPTAAGLAPAEEQP